MNLKKILAVSAISLSMVAGVGAAIGVSAGTNLKEAEVKAAGETYYLVGNTNGIGWPTDPGKPEATAIDVTEGGDSVGITFAAADEFKFALVGSWSGSLGIANIGGTAAAYFSEGNDGNFKCDIAGTYYVSIADGKVYFDLQNGEKFYYTGTANDWGVLSAKPIELNGSAVSFSLTQDEKLKFRTDHGWKIALGIDDLASTYYKCFESSGTDIKVNHTDTYDVRIYSVGHSLKANIAAHDPHSKTVYVLDLEGDLLNVSHKAHFFSSVDRIETDWPGIDMPLVDGTVGIFKAEYWDALDTVIFNQKGDGEKTGQTINLSLSGNENKCLALTHDVNGELKWNSTNWLSMEAANFIDSKMHIADVPLSVGGTTANCATYYGAAKSAYNVLSSNAVRLEVLSVKIVSDRLSAWATANHDTLDAVSGGTIASARIATSPLNSNNNTNFVLIASIAAGTVITAVGATFLLRRRKEDR